MRALALVPLLLFGLLQAVAAPPAPSPRLDDRPGLRALPGAPAQPAESPTAIARLAPSAPAAVIAGDGKQPRGFLAPDGARAPAITTAAWPFTPAATAGATSPTALPPCPRAPPRSFPV